MKKLAMLITVVIAAAYLLLYPKQINKNIDFDKDDIMAITFIGGMEGYYDYSVPERLFPGEEFETIHLGGSEKYLIMPRYNQPVSVYSVYYEDGGSKREFVKEVTGNFYITCNESDIFSNVQLSTEVNTFFRGRAIAYSPFLSGKDGSVVLMDGVKEIKDI